MSKIIDNVMDEVQGILALANDKLQKMTEGKFPFTFEEVVMTADTDSAGIYIRSGATPVVAAARGKDPEYAIKKIKDAVWHEVDLTRAAIEMRSSLKEEAATLKADSDKQSKAKAALEAAGLPTDMLNGGVNAEAAAAVVAAAKKAVKHDNHRLRLRFGEDLCAIFGGKENMKLKIVGFAGGFVVTAGGKPCMITRYPKITNAKAIERMIKFVESDIQALSESRMEYFSYLREKMDFEACLRNLAASRDRNDADIIAMAM